MSKYQAHLNEFETHRMIKRVIPNAVTQYDLTNKGQMTMEEWFEYCEAEEEQAEMEFSI